MATRRNGFYQYVKGGDGIPDNLEAGLWLSGPEYVVNWTLVLAWVLILTIPLLFKFDWKLVRDVEVPKIALTVIKHTDMHPAAHGGGTICTLKKGQRAFITGYAKDKESSSDNNHYLQVRTDKGDIGFVNSTAFNARLTNLAHIIKQVPHIHTNSTTLTPHWVARHLFVNRSKRSNVEDYWWGVPIALKHNSDGSETVYYPVGDLKPLAITYKNDVVRKIENIGGGYSISTPLSNSTFFARFHADDIITRPVDVEGADWDSFYLFGLLQFVFFLVFYAYYSFIAVRFSAIFAMPLGFIPYLSYLLPLAMIFMNFIFMVFLFAFWQLGTGWIIYSSIIAIFFACFWFYWCKWNHCPRCGRFYTKECVDEDYNENYETEVTRHYDVEYEVTTENKYRNGQLYESREVDRRETNRTYTGRTENTFKLWEHTYHLVCLNCRAKSKAKSSGADLVKSNYYDA